MLPTKEFFDFIDENRLFNVDKKLLAAVSGGKDSVLLARLLKKAGYHFSIAHCNFRLRGSESDRDEDFTANLARQLEVPFFSKSFNTVQYATEKNISIQMAARELRYDWFNELKSILHFDLIALAHHQNDAVETILLNLVRGTGIAGLHGILSKNGDLVRPLLFLNREQIDHIVKQEQLDFVEDSSNASIKYARNLLRLEVIPKLKQLNPALEETFEKNKNRFLELEQLLENQLSILRKEILIEKDGVLAISIANIKKLKPQQLLLFGLFREYGFAENVLADLIRSLDKHPGKMFESPGFTLLLDRTHLLLIKKSDIKPLRVAIRQTDKEIDYPNYRLHLLHDGSPLIVKDNAMAASVDAEKLNFPLSMRPWQAGDYFYPLGMQKRKKLSDYLINEKVPLLLKNKVPVLVNGNGEIIWVGGLRMDDRYKVTRHTKKVIIFELFNRSL
ncbi:MAG: tRNA lysidine(34) synthetase TilS [Sphingobacteriaceae bacterium]